MPGRVATTAVAAAAVVWLALSDGGYFPTQWGALILAFTLAAVALLLAADRIQLGRRDLLLLGGLGALAAWQLLSAVWSPGAGAPVLEVERTAVYGAAVGAMLLGVDRSRAPALFHGLALGTGVAGIVGLVSYLSPDAPRAASERLADPIGYANGDGFLAGIGLLLACALALRGPLLVRTSAAAATVPLAVGLYLSFSRGAMLAVLAGFVVLLGAERQRLRALALVLALALPCAAAAGLAATLDALTGSAGLDEMESASRTLLVAVVLLALAAVACTAISAWLERRLVVGATARRRLGVALVAVVLLASAGLLAATGGPVAAVQRATDALVAPPPAGQTGEDLNRRLLSASSNARADYWRVAWGMAKREPLIGEGAGSYERWWLEERPLVEHVRDAHSLYLEALGELGVVGLALVLLVVAVPLVAIERARGAAATSGAAGVFAAFAVHAAIDWDWELPVLTLVALACGSVLVVLAREGRAAPVTSPRRALMLGVALPLVVLGLVAHAGNRAVARSEDAMARGDLGAAMSAAVEARRWSPWAALPWQLLGEARLAAGDDDGARKALRRSLELDAESWSAWYELAVVVRGRERRAALSRAAALNPLSPEVEELTQNG